MPINLFTIFFFNKQSVHQLYKPCETFFLIGYSFGGLLALELAKMLENVGINGHIVLMDCGPLFLQKLVLEQIPSLDSVHSKETVNALQTLVLSGVTSIISPTESMEIRKAILECKTWEERIDKLVKFSANQTIYSVDYLKNIVNALYCRLTMVFKMDLNCVDPVNSPITLIRPNHVSLANIDEDYGLGKYTNSSCTLKFMEGNHMTMIENDELPMMLNKLYPVAAQDDK